MMSTHEAPYAAPTEPRSKAALPRLWAEWCAAILNRLADRSAKTAAGFAQ